MGSENLHFDQRSWAPHISYEYVTSNMRSALYIDATGFKRNESNSNSYLDSGMQLIPYDEKYTYWHIMLHAGFKAFLNGDADKKAPLIFLGGGFADCISLNRHSALGTDPQHPLSLDNKWTDNSFGLGFLAGAQYYLKPVIIELKGNLDFVLKPISEYAGSTNVHTDTRLTILVPLHSFK